MKTHTRFNIKISSKTVYLLVLLLITTLTLGTEIVRVKADIPDVLSIISWTSGGDTILNITIRHALPSSSHYINQVEVDKDGSVQVINLTPQSTDNFMIQHNLGIVAGTANVRARAHCVVHGWGSWSLSVVIPEFSSIFIPAILGLLAITTLLARSKLVKLKAE